ncbi:MAG TPA: hypothetical protein VE621_06865 [Bryobacteraceae bacterium]|nr:hypothetical protein [Bryobacteraceae bacterium]
MVDASRPEADEEERRIKRMALLAGFLLMAASSHLKAFNLDRLIGRIDVPFDFHVGQIEMPAGAYLIQQEGALITIKTDGVPRKSAHYLTTPASGKTDASKGKAVFNRYGDDYFLSAVFAANATQGYQLPRTKREREVMARAKLTETAGVVVKPLDVRKSK